MATNPVGSSPSEPNKQSASVSDEHTAMVVNKIFQMLQAAFPAWRNSFGDSDSINTAKKLWIKAFQENGISSVEQVGHGMRKARASKKPFWPAVGEFVSWCKPSAEEIGLPPLAGAYREAANYRQGKELSHPAVYVALREVGIWEMRTLEERVSWKLFRTAYETICQRIVDGEEIDVEIPKALPTPESVPLTAEQIEQKKQAGITAIAELRKIMGVTE